MWEIAEYAIDRLIVEETDWSSYEGRHVILPRRVCITVATAPSAAAWVVREACVLESLRHSGVPRVYDCGLLSDGLPWVTRELVTGASVGSTVAPRELAELLRDVGAILAHAHARGVIHGDVWLDSIIKADVVRLVGWHRARQGTPTEAAADIYALGLAAYAALPAKPPRRLVALIAEMLAADTAARPTADALVAQAARIVDEPADDDVEEVALTVDLSREPLLWAATDPDTFSDSSGSPS